MSYSSLVSAEITLEHLENPDWRIIDCQFDLKDKNLGYNNYKTGHIPGAIYADLDKDLSSPVTGVSGRHPLPSPEKICQTFGQWGIDTDTQVVVYDNVFGSFAARLWWLLKWMGHTKVAVLNGGLQYWKQMHYPLSKDTPNPKTTNFQPTPNMQMVVDAGKILQLLPQSRIALVDVRDPQRYSGTVEPIDKVAGHIPGALNIPWKTNLDKQGLYLNPPELITHYKAVLDNHESEDIVFMCGSGVTACHSLVALHSAGITNAKLYPGSWSEWIQDPSRPIESSE